MIIKNISLVNFRNYKNCSFDLNPCMNIFIGDNAQGKTNILESIYLLALTKSYRIGSESNLIKFGENEAKIKGIIQNGVFLKDLELYLSSKEKRVYINKNQIKKISEYISNLNVIIFTPDDLDIIKGSPGIRRNLLNIQISQISKLYLETYNAYNKILKTRNEYLKMLYINHIADNTYLDILTDQLIEKAIIIYKMRKKYIDQINEQIGSIYQEITDLKNLRVKYEPNIFFETENEEQMISILKNTFKDSFQKELMQGITLFGPHRDDFSFYLNDVNLKYYGSQGQQRLSIICFKLSEISIFKKYTNTNPILLLDDIFSEIDTKKKNRLLNFINKEIQSIITTTDLKNINKKILTGANVYKVSNGVIEKKEG